MRGPCPHPYIDRDELHDIYRSLWAIADEYGAVFVGEVWLPDAERFARCLRPDDCTPPSTAGPARGRRPARPHPDPMHARSGGTDPGRDGCRIPLPWEAGAPHAGFGSPGEPWLPQPEGWAAYAVDRQSADPGSMLTLYREALALRRAEGGFGDGPTTWLPAPDCVLAFARPVGLLRQPVRNPADLPPCTHRLLTSGSLTDAGKLPPDMASRLRTGGRDD